MFKQGKRFWLARDKYSDVIFAWRNAPPTWGKVAYRCMGWLGAGDPEVCTLRVCLERFGFIPEPGTCVTMSVHYIQECVATAPKPESEA